jgi:hypothetical protein
MIRKSGDRFFEKIMLKQEVLRSGGSTAFGVICVSVPFESFLVK